MDFFARQDSARAKSRAFYIGFFFTVLLAVVILYFVITLAIGAICFIAGYTVPGYHPLPLSIYGYPPEVLSLRPFLVISPFVLGTIVVVSIVKVLAIRIGGGVYLAQRMGGRELLRPQTEAEKRLLHVVEEMAVASGLPRPMIFILEHELSINAVTAGLNHEDAFIAVTQGALDLLDRDELQAVVAHEFAHIFNGDYRLNMTMAGWLYGLLFFSARGKDLTTLASHINGRGAIYPFIIGIILWLGGWAGKLSAEILEAAFSRQREYLADAFSAQFTRNPKALAGALLKVAGLSWAGAITSGQSLAMKSFFMVSPAKVNGLLRTHPPLKKRILALNPEWDGHIPTISPKIVLNKRPEPQPAAGRPAPRPADALRTDAILSPGGWATALAILSAAGESAGGGQEPRAGAARSQLMAGSLKATEELLAQVPQNLRAAAVDANLAPALVASLFIHADEDFKKKQADIVRHFLGDELTAKTGEFHSQLTDSFRLPLLNLSAPALKHVAPEIRRGLGRAATELAKVDGRLDFFEVAAGCVLDKYLNRDLSPAGQYADMEAIKADIAEVLDFVAVHGADDRQEADKAFTAGAAVFPGWYFGPKSDFQKTPPEELCPLLGRLSRTEGGLRRKLVTAAVAVASFDGQITEAEYEIVRSLAAALEVPLPLLTRGNASPVPGGPDGQK